MSKRTSKRVASLAAAVVVGVLAVSPALAGQTPVDEEYEDAIAGETTSGSRGTLGAESTSGDLPFTGFEAVAVLAGGLGVATIGLALRRATRTSRN
jgi:hypothetical protein